MLLTASSTQLAPTGDAILHSPWLWVGLVALVAGITFLIFAKRRRREDEPVAGTVDAPAGGESADGRVAPVDEANVTPSRAAASDLETPHDDSIDGTRL